MYYFADIAQFLSGTRTDPALWSSVRPDGLSLTAIPPQDASLRL